MNTLKSESKPIIEVNDTIARRLKAYARHKRHFKLLQDKLEKERDSLLVILGNEARSFTNNGQKLASVLNFPKTYVDGKMLKENFLEVYNRVTRTQDEIQLRTH